MKKQTKEQTATKNHMQEPEYEILSEEYEKYSGQYPPVRNYKDSVHFNPCRIFIEE